jgi:hypothetical protein
MYSSLPDLDKAILGHTGSLMREIGLWFHLQVTLFENGR